MTENVRAREIEDVPVREIEDRDVLALVRVLDVLGRVHEVQKKVNIAAICDDDQKKHLREKEAESAQKEVRRHPTSADRLMFPQQKQWTQSTITTMYLSQWKTILRIIYR